MNESTLTTVKNMAKDQKEAKRKRQIDFLRTHYNKAIVDAAIEYADNEIELSPSYPHNSFADFIEMQMDIDIQDVFNILTFAYVHGMSFGLSNPNISKTPDPVTDYVLSKDFAFIFDYGDNDFSTCIFNAAQEFCNEYNRLLRQIELYSASDCSCDNMVESYKKNIEFMEDPNNIRQLIKAAFIGDYMKSSIDSCWIGGNKEFKAMSLLNKAQNLANNYFNFETDTQKNQTDSVRVNWKFGTWNEVSKFGLEKYKTQQGDEELENANGDFTKYWLNGEVLIVRMVGGKLVAETH